jgi:formate/nitrite transporter FocA (FNT family)
VKLRNSNSPQFWYSSGGLCIKTIHRLAVGGMMDKLKNLLWYIFLFRPLTFFVGLSIIVLGDEKIIGGNFQVTTFKKTKRQIDKEKFAKFMQRICK